MNEITRMQRAPEVEQTSLADLIKAKRAEKGMTQKELAEAVGISVSALKQYESGRQEPPMTKAKQIAAALDISANDIWSELSGGNASDEPLRQTVLQDVKDFVETGTTNQMKQVQAFVEKMRDGESVENDEQEILPSTAFQKLVAAIDKNGFKSRSLSKLVTGARDELLEQDDEYLDALAGDYAVELPDDMEPEQAVDLVLSVALYSEDVMQREDRELDAIVEWINERPYLPREAFDTRRNAIETKGWFEDRETYNSRLYLKVPKCLVEAAINRHFLPEGILKTDV